MAHDPIQFAIDRLEESDPINAQAAQRCYDSFDWWGVAGLLLALALGYLAGQW